MTKQDTMLRIMVTPHKALQWICDTLVFLPVSGPKLKGQSIGGYLLPFQEHIIKEALTSDGEPNKNIFLGFSRKISKSMMFSWILNYFAENKEGFHSVLMASTFGQSNVIYSLVKDQVLLNPKIDKTHYKITRENLVNKEKHNSLHKIFNEAPSNLGLLNVSCVCSDELGAQKSRANLNSITSGLAMAQTKPLLLYSANRPEEQSHWSNEFLRVLEKNPKWSFFNFSADMKLDPFFRRSKMPS